MACEGGAAKPHPGRGAQRAPGAACLEAPAATGYCRARGHEAACFPGWAPCFSRVCVESCVQAALCSLPAHWPSVTGVPERNVEPGPGMEMAGPSPVPCRAGAVQGSR